MAKVDILNYISDSNILRSTYDTDTNELDITDVPQNLNSVITLGQGGGGSVTVEELNVTENGTYEAPEGKAYSPVNVNVSGGGDSGPFHLLNTINVDEDVRGVSVELDSYMSYDFFFFVMDVELTASDYLYFIFDSTTPGAGSYTPSSQLTFKGFYGFVMQPNGFLLHKAWAKTNSTSFEIVNADTPKTNIYFSTYQASRLIKAGSVVRIYGGNYADL